ncbi:hypothetical protein M407DRAFT_118808 [Tulasnella calospora MUT 4182]|uniref:Uncharacterized protein n=1 Tax=Tulasnella calospora MUT 4182 TaxID=1051891 RepID=A0A0C3QIT7_9AGAM|nr:hypothetical protein M407DRAFT_118808 [Tulasnella calospora MUT 4182]
MALFASSYLIGDALYWYEGLEEDVQNDWSRLRPALLARFGRSGPPPTAASSTPVISAPAPPTTIPTPAAAPPTTRPRPLVRKGRLKVLNADGSLCGYSAESGDLVDGMCRTLSTGPDGALLISFIASPSGEPFEIQILDDPPNTRATDRLAVCWGGLAQNRWQSEVTSVASSCRFSSIASSKNWDIKKKVWAISNSGELSVDYPKPDGGTEGLQPFIRQSANYLYWLRSSRSNTRGFNPVRIVVEDVV